MYKLPFHLKLKNVNLAKIDMKSCCLNFKIKRSWKEETGFGEWPTIEKNRKTILFLWLVQNDTVCFLETVPRLPVY